MKKFFYVVAVVILSCVFTACDADDFEAFRYGWNSTTPSKWHFAPEYNQEPDSMEVILDIEGDELL